jgi:hypothetical protein
MMKYFKCNKCGGSLTTITDESIPNIICLEPMKVRISGICGGEYIEITKEEYDLTQEYWDICEAGFVGTIEDYKKYKSTYGKEIKKDLLSETNELF